MVCPDVDLFGGFSLNPADITLGLQLLLPCCLLNLAIMLPDYSSWKVPAEPSLEAQQKMAEALLVWTTNKRAAADAAKASTAAGQGAAADSASAISSSDVPAASTSTSGTDATQQQADQDRQPVQPAAASSSSAPEPVPAAVTPPWLINNPDPPLPLSLARCKDAMLMAQVSHRRMCRSPLFLCCSPCFFCSNRLWRPAKFFTFCPHLAVCLQ